MSRIKNRINILKHYLTLQNGLEIRTDYTNFIFRNIPVFFFFLETTIFKAYLIIINLFRILALKSQ